jgi:hypothetical protein
MRPAAMPGGRLLRLFNLPQQSYGRFIRIRLFAASMALARLVTSVFALLITGLLRPQPHGGRMALFLALIMFGALTIIGGDMLFSGSMTLAQLVISVFALLIAGLLLPLSYGARLALFLALVMIGVLTLVGGGAQYLIGLTQ